MATITSSARGTVAPQSDPDLRSDDTARSDDTVRSDDTDRTDRAFAAKALAALRIATGFVFLWAFLDKAFGLGYATPSANAWIEGGSPAKGFLSGVAVGPLEGTFHAWAGDAWADWLFMLGLLGIGVAVMAGVALRAAAVSGTLMMLLMWAAEWPLAKHLSDGSPSMSNNPLVDYHIIYALALIAVAFAHAGDTWGLGRVWARLPFVQRHRSLLR
jgi:thiosulfate dehydrogenase [quinone] large subunit